MKTNPLEAVSDEDIWKEWQRVQGSYEEAAHKGRTHTARSFGKRAAELEAEWFRRYPVMERGVIYSARGVTSETVEITVANAWAVGL